MPDVGVLNLQIRDDSNEAASGLDQLVSKLRSLGKIASTKNEGLGNVAQHIRDIVGAVKFDNSKVETSLKNISTFMNSLSGLTKLNTINKLNVKPIEQLKTAIGEGFNIGQAGTQINRLREAIAGDWNVENARNARDSMKLIASGIHELEKAGSTKSIDAIASSLEKYNGIMNSMMPVKQDEPFMQASKAVRSGVVDYTKAVEEYGDAMERTKLTFKEPMGLDLQQFSYKKGMVSEGQIKMDLDALGKWGNGFTEVKQTIENASEPVKTFNDTISETSAVAKSTQLSEFLVDPITQLMERFANCAAVSETLGRAFNASAYSTSLLSAEAITASKNVETLMTKLNTPIKYKGLRDVVDHLNGIGRSFISAKDSAQAFENTSMGDMRIELQETGDVIQSAVINRLQEMYSLFGQMAHNFGWFKKETMRLTEGPDIHRPVADEHMLSTYVDTWKPDWIFGEGTVEEAEAVKDELLNISKEALQINAEMHQKYAAYNERTLEDFYNGIHWGRNENGEDFRYIQSDLMSKWLHGEGSIKEQTYAIDEMAERFGMSVEEVRSRIAQLKSEADSTVPSIEGLARAMDGASTGKGLVRDYGHEMVDDLVSHYSKIDLMELKLEGMKQALADDINMNRVDSQQIAERTSRIQDLIGAIERLKNAQSGSSSTIGKMQTGWNVFRRTLRGVFPTLTGMVKRFGQIAKYRFLRTVLKQITSGAKEGLENVYRYSQIIGTSFAPSMDSAASALAQMKNSIGAALAPALQAVIPVLNNIVSAFVNVINVANQFFAILGGQSSWTRAKPYAAKAFDDIKDSAKGAGSATKDLLADWDELNIIQGSSGGGGGSGKEIPDYASMFEEVDIFDSRISAIANLIKENFDEILATVLAVKGAIFAWRLSNGLASALPVLSKIAGGIAVGATIGVTLMLTDLTGKAYKDTGDVGWLIADGLAGAIGSTLARKIATKIAGGKIGWATQGFTLILSGAVNVINAVDSAKEGADAQAWALGALGSIEAGIGAALVAKGLLATSTAFSLGAGVITAGLTLGLVAYLIIDAKRKASYQKMAFDAFSKAGAGGIDPAAYIKALQAELDKRTANAQLVVDASLGLDESGEKYTEAIESLKALNRLITEDGLSEEDATKFKEAWDIVLEELGKISEISYKTIYAGLDEAIAHGTEEIRNAATSYRKEVLKAEATMNGMRSMLKKELEFLEKELLSGSTEPEVIERYKKIYTELAKTTESGLSQFKVALENGARFDFSHGDNPVEEATQFINSIEAESIQPAIEKAHEQYDAEMSALNKARDELELYKNLGYVDENSTTYKQLTELYNGLEETYKKNLESQVKEIEEMKQGAFDAIANQAIEGYLSLDQKDENALKAYADNVFKPIAEAIEKAGGKVPKELEAWIARNGQSGEVADAVEMIRESTREGIYAAFQTQQEVGDIDDALKMSIAYEVDLVGGDLSKITEDERKEIVQALYDVFEDPYNITEQLHTNLNWSLEDILNSFDMSKLDVGDLEDLLTLFEELRAAEEEGLYGRAHADTQSPEYLEYNDYLEKMREVASTYDSLKKKVQSAIDAKGVREEETKRKTNSIASAYEDMASRIKAAVGSLAGIGFNLSATAFSGKINVAWPTQRASGGFVKSGDIVMANENGNFEMMGKMGNQPVVANNQQIVSGISQGVATANEGVESRLSAIETLLTRVLQKEFVAKASPSSTWGAMNERSGIAYDRVRG